MPTGVAPYDIFAFALVEQVLNTLCKAQHETMQADMCAKQLLGIPVLRPETFKGHLQKANSQKAD